MGNQREETKLELRIISDDAEREAHFRQVVLESGEHRTGAEKGREHAHRDHVAALDDQRGEGLVVEKENL